MLGGSGGVGKLVKPTQLHTITATEHLTSTSRVG
eukprot:gene26417-biopygen16382